MTPLDLRPWREAGPWKREAKGLQLFHKEQPIKKGHEMALMSQPQLPLPD